MLKSIQACRGVAALLVLLYHLNTAIFNRPKYFPTQPFGPIFDFGHSGVEFFFVLSGFIIAFAHGRDVGVPATAPRYVSRRLQRIYPIYWVVLAALIPTYLAMPAFGVGHETEATTILSSALLVFWDGNTILAPAWTLYHEVAFYAAFVVLIWNRGAGVALFAAWIAGIAAFHLFGVDAAPVANFLASPLNLLFPLGMLAAVLHRSTIRLPAREMAAAGGILFMAAGVIEVTSGLGGVGPLIYGVTSALLIVGLARLESAGHLRTPDAFAFLGAASYSIYLTHFPALSLYGKAAVAAGLQSAPGWLMFLLIGGGTLAIGCAFYAFVERPLLRWLGARRHGLLSPPQAATPD